MKQTQVAKLRKYVDRHDFFTLKTVQKITNANNCYSIIHDLRKEIYIASMSVKNNNGVRFNVYYEPIARLMLPSYLRKHNLELA